jgi:hypothetical protein
MAASLLPLKLKVEEKQNKNYYMGLEFQNQDGTWYNGAPLPGDATGISIAFNSDGTFTDAGGFDPHNGTWKLSSDGATLTTEQSITYGTPFINQNSTVTILNSTTLQIVTPGGPFMEQNAQGVDKNFYGERDTYTH